MVASLSDVPLFSGLDPASCAEIESRMARRDFPPQATLMREGSVGDAAFLLLAGHVSVRRRDPDTGIEFELAQLGPGQMIGEMALLAGKARNASVVALEPTACAVLSRADFDQALRQHPAIALSLARSIAERLDRANERAGVDFISLSRLQIDPRVLALLPQTLVNQHKVLPISFSNNRLTLAMTNPNNILALDDVRRVIKGVMIEPVAVAEDDFKRFVSTAYAAAVAKQDEGKDKARPKVDRTQESIDLLQSDLIRELQLAEDTTATGPETKQDLMTAPEDAPIIRLANSVLGIAINPGANDIHIETIDADVTVKLHIYV